MVLVVNIESYADKGSFFMLEAAIAILIMITTLALVLRQPQTTQELDVVNYKLKIYNALKISDSVGELRRDALNGDVGAIKDYIELNAPSYLNTEVAIYNKTTNVTEIPVINSRTILTVSYFLAGYVGNYEPREVRVYIWGID